MEHGREQHYRDYLADNPRLHMLIVPLLIALAISIYGLVYFTGGIKYVYSHSMYLPILVAGVIYGIGGGILMGVAGGILLGPIMPIDTVTNESQKMANWLFRMAFFIGFGTFVGAHTDILCSKMKRIKFLAFHDEETGLPNRNVVIRQLNHLLNSEVVDLDQHVLMKISCDNLSEIEMTFGTNIADEIVRQMNGRIHGLLTEGDLLAKITRNEFAIIARSQNKIKTSLFAKRIINHLKHSYVIDEIELHVECFIGYVALSERVEDADDFLQMARLALSQAKSSHIKYHPYISSMHQRGKETLSLLGQLRHAIENNELRLFYQPKVSLTDDAIVGAEALMRWQHPTQGMIPPVKFIPKAEQCELIGDLTEWALHEAAQQLATWKKEYENVAPRIAVNISAYDLADKELPNLILRLLSQNELDPSVLEIEVTENALMENITETKAIIKCLGDSNITVALDDFGTGYSSLKYLDQLPVDYIKIDQSFIFRLLSDHGSKSIVQASISLAHSLGLKVIAEGVETQEAYEMLRAMGCEIAQGYFIAHPMPGDEFIQWYKSHHLKQGMVK